jgi:hypothetical protein
MYSFRVIKVVVSKKNKVIISTPRWWQSHAYSGDNRGNPLLSGSFSAT